MTSRSSPWTDSRFLTNSPSSPSSESSGSRSGRARLRASSSPRIASIWASEKAITPRLNCCSAGSAACCSTCSTTRSATRDRLDAVGAGAAAIVDAVRHVLERDDALVGVRAREGPEPAVVEGGVREGDQVLVAAAVVPEQRTLRQARVEAGVQHALGRLLVRVVAEGVEGGDLEEAGRRKLATVADDDDLAGAADRADGVGGEDLARLVEDDEVEGDGRVAEVLRDRERAHQQARLEARQQVGKLGEEATERLEAALLAGLAQQQPDLGAVQADAARPGRCRPSRPPRQQRRRDALGVQLPLVTIEPAQLFDGLLVLLAAEPRQRRGALVAPGEPEGEELAQEGVDPECWGRGLADSPSTKPRSPTDASSASSAWVSIHSWRRGSAAWRSRAQAARAGSVARSRGCEPMRGPSSPNEAASSARSSWRRASARRKLVVLGDGAGRLGVQGSQEGGRRWVVEAGAQARGPAQRLEDARPVGIEPLEERPEVGDERGHGGGELALEGGAGQGVAGLGEEIGRAGGGLEAAGVERIGGRPERRQRGEPGFDLSGKLLEGRDRLPLPLGEGWGEGSLPVFTSVDGDGRPALTPTLSQRERGKSATWSRSVEGGVKLGEGGAQVGGRAVERGQAAGTRAAARRRAASGGDRRAGR